MRPPSQVTARLYCAVQNAGWCGPTPPPNFTCDCMFERIFLIAVSNAPASGRLPGREIAFTLRMTNGTDRAARRQSSRTIRRNIQAIAQLEEDFVRNRSPAVRLADSIAEFSGTLTFVTVHAVVFIVWILINVGVFPFVRKFDPFPFMLLSVSVSLEAIFLATFVLIKQNRMSQRADQRAHLDLQINLLTEQEMTHVLQILQKISRRLQVPLS